MATQKYTNIHEAKTHLSRLIERALSGEEVIIARAGKPLVKIVAVEDVQKKERRVGGQLRGQIWIADDFDAPDPEIESMFYDGPIFPEPDHPMWRELEANANAAKAGRAKQQAPERTRGKKAK